MFKKPDVNTVTFLEEALETDTEAGKSLLPFLASTVPEKVMRLSSLKKDSRQGADFESEH